METVFKSLDKFTERGVHRWVYQSLCYRNITKSLQSKHVSRVIRFIGLILWRGKVCGNGYKWYMVLLISAKRSVEKAGCFAPVEKAGKIVSEMTYNASTQRSLTVHTVVVDLEGRGPGPSKNWGD